MTTTQNIELAIAELRAAKKPNIAATARKYKIERTRLHRLFKGTIGTREQFIESKQLLSQQQDLRLLKVLNRLTKDGIPPTPKIVRQLAHDLWQAAFKELAFNLAETASTGSHCWPLNRL